MESMINYHRINVSLNGVYLFATEQARLCHERDARLVFRLLKSKFPESEGYSVTCDYWKGQGKAAFVEQEINEEYICETCISAIRSRGEIIMQGEAVDVSDEPKACWWCKTTDEETLYTFTIGEG